MFALQQVKSPSSRDDEQDKDDPDKDERDEDESPSSRRDEQKAKVVVDISSDADGASLHGQDSGTPVALSVCNYPSCQFVNGDGPHLRPCAICRVGHQ